MTIRRGIKYASVGMAGLLALAILLTAGFVAYNRWNFPDYVYPWVSSESFDDILALASRGEAEKALNAVQDIGYDVHGSMRGSVMRDVIDILAERGQIREVREFALRLSDMYERNVHLLWLAKTQAEAGDIDDALELVASVAGSDGIVAGLRSVAIGAARSGNIDRALTVARGMDRAFDRVAALNGIGLILAENGDPAAGRKIVEDSLIVARSIADEREQRSAVVGTAIAIARLGDWQYATELAATADPDNRVRYAVPEFARILVDAGALEAARDTARRIADATSRDDAVEAIMRLQLTDGDIAGALETATIIPAGAERDKFLSRIARRFPYGYKPEPTFPYDRMPAQIKVGAIDTMLAITDAVEDNAWRDVAYGCIAAYAASEIDIIWAIQIILMIEDSEEQLDALALSLEGLLFGYSSCTPQS